MKPSNEELDYFKVLISTHEEWLMNAILNYAEEYDFTRYTSTLKEAWRVSIAELSRSLLELMQLHKNAPELHPDEDYIADPAAAFGMLEAKRHRSRGVNLAMFLALFKYYRQSYHDLLFKESKQFGSIKYFAHYIDRFFDRTEIGYCTEWAGLSSEKQIQELSSTNLTMTNEKNKYLTLFDSFASPAALVDKEGYIENLNLVAEEIFMGKSVPGGHYYKEDKSKVKFEWIEREIQEMIASHKSELSFEKLHDKTGFIFDVKIAKLHDVSKKFVGYTLLMNDITSIRKAEEELKTLTDKQIEQERMLIQQSKLAAMGEMMGSIAHQWRQPLNQLHINIEMLEEHYEAEHINKKFLEDFILKNTNTLQFLSKTIDDFSNFFRFNKQKIHFSLQEKIENTLNIIDMQLKKSGIKYEIHGEDIEVFGLPNEFQQVILNLINNAKDSITESKESTNEGKITISLSKDEKNAYVTIDDNGGGIPANIIDRIFEPYFTTKEQGKGIGMGLYISKMIIEQNLGGKLQALNVEGGARFKITLDIEHG